MNSKRVYYLMVAAVLLLAAGLLGAAYGANLLLKGESDKLVSYKLKTEALDQQQSALTKAKADVEKYQSLEKIAKAVVPQDKDQAKAVREIVKIAANSGIRLGTISFPSSTLGATAVPTSGGPSSPAASAASNKAALSQLTPVPNIPGVFDLQINVQSDPNSPVTYSRFLAFLDALEHNRRTAQVNSITLQPNAEDRNNLSFTLLIDEYIKP